MALQRQRGTTVGIGTVVRAVVRAAMQADEVAVITADLEARAGVASAAPSSVRDGAASVPPSGAAPARAVRVRPKLEVVVARAASTSSGPLLPVELAAARQRIRAGGVMVDGAIEKDPNVQVDPGTVVVR